MPRIVSLIASATEIVCALGCEDKLVGRSHECDFPKSVKKLPICTEPKFDVIGSSCAIDQRVKGLLQEGLSVYRVHADKLKALRPDVIITQSQCEVCAVSLRDVEEAVDSILEARPRIVNLAPNALADVWTDIQTVANGLDVPKRGESLLGRLHKRLDRIVDKARSVETKPAVGCIEWIDPLMASGNWMPELVELAGGVNLFGKAGQPVPWLTWEEFRNQDPEIILVLPCGFDIERTRQEMPALTSRPDWNGLRAVQNKKVFLLDGNQYFNRPGPRIVESLEILAQVVHPEAFRASHEGKGWEAL
jgi:iron complex transport system substrate-binding protein